PSATTTQRRARNEGAKERFVARESSRALNIRAPMLGSFAHGGTRPQRAKCSSRRAVAAVAAGAAGAAAAAGPAGVSPEVLGPEEPVTGEPPPGVSAPEEPVPVVSAPGLLVLEVCGR